MNKFIITTDTACDLPEDFLKQHQVYAVPLFYLMDGILYGAENKLAPKDFYDMMRGGKMPTTNAVNPEDYKDAVRPYLEDGYDILHIAFSSGLSSSCQNAVLAVNDLQEDFPDRKMVIVDSRCASLGQGLAVYYAVQMKENGKSLEEIEQWLLEMRPHFCHQFTVNDLFHLHRGGRVSKATAIVGTLANIKPVLHVDGEGKLVAIGKVMGRKKSLSALVDNMAAAMGSYQNDFVFISHGDCLEDAEYVANLIKNRFGIETRIMDYVSPTIGAHTGPGVVALFFLGETR